MNRIERTGGLSGLLGVMAVAATLSHVTPEANAAVVVHDNRDGTFQWTRTIKLTEGEPILGTFLDIRQPPTQSGERLPGTLGSWFYLNNSTSSPGVFAIQSEGTSVKVAQNDSEKLYEWNGQDLVTRPLREYNFNEFVTANDRWRDAEKHYWSLPFNFGFDGGTPLISNLAYFGVRLEVGVGLYNYGWVLFENWTNPVMWAWETELNTPIQIPVPGPGIAACAAVTSLWLAVRRRRLIASC